MDFENNRSVIFLKIHCYKYTIGILLPLPLLFIGYIYIYMVGTFPPLDPDLWRSRFWSKFPTLWFTWDLSLKQIPASSNLNCTKQLYKTIINFTEQSGSLLKKLKLYWTLLKIQDNLWILLNNFFKLLLLKNKKKEQKNVPDVLLENGWFIKSK